MSAKNPHLQRHVLKTETYHELQNSRISPKKKKSLNGRIGGLSRTIKPDPSESPEPDTTPDEQEG